MKKLLSFLVFLLIPALLSAQSASTARGKGDAASEKKGVAATAVDSIDKTIVLGEVVVVAPIREVEMRGDTTVINADAYKTPEGAYLEELVKRIPGLEYDRQTKELTYNGLAIKEINVNGEAFFNGNTALALENLPANLVSKIRVYDKRSELEKITKVRQGDENYVLDLQTRKEFSGTLMAQAEAGCGNNRKKDASLMGNYFKQGGENFSLIARSGNKNMTTDYRGNRQDNISLNFMKKLTPKLSLFGNAMYNGGDNGNETTAYNEQYLTTSNRYQYSAGSSVNSNRMGSAMLGVRWQIDEKTYVNVNANANRSKSDNSNDNRNATFTADPMLTVTDPFGDDNIYMVEDSLRVNDISMKSLSKSTNSGVGFNADFTRVLNERGTSVSVTAQYNDNSSKADAFSVSSTTYFQVRNALGGDSILYRNQYSHSPSSQRSGSVGVMFTQPVAKGLMMQLSYKFSRSRQRSDRNTYDLSPFFGSATDAPADYLPEGYEQGYTDSLSNRSLSKTTAHEAALRLSYNSKAWEVDMGIAIQPERRTLDQKTGMMMADTVRSSVNFTPTFSASWRHGKTRLRFTYAGSTQQPSLSDLLTLTDNSDPLNIATGNPDLKAAYMQNLRFEARDTKIGLSGDINFTNTFNSQTRAVSYDLRTGGRTSRPVNINGNWNARATLRYQKRIKKQFNVSTRLGMNLAESVSLVNEGQSEEPERSLTRNTGCNANLRLGWHPQWGGFDASGDWRWRRSTNRLHDTDNYTRNYSFSLNAFAELPLGLQLRSDITRSFRNGTNINAHDDDQTLWNVGCTWRFLKNKQAELSLNWTDILSDKKNYSRNATSTGLYESHSQQIGGYFMLSFKYRFNRQL